LKQQRVPKRWFVIPAIFGLIGGIIVYFLIRNRDPSRARWCVIVGFVSSVTLFLVLVAIGFAASHSEPVPPMPLSPLFEKYRGAAALLL
jgi:RsiW-degrading membrane proteinase PrsW (M82 family)